MSDAGIYVHIPFCSRICHYCDFAVLTGNERRRDGFIDHLVREIETSSRHTFRFDTIYFGGGTPSMLSHQNLTRIFDAIERGHNIADDRAIHFEANPEDVTASRLEEWRSLGVGTLSLGVQSFDPKRLAFLGRKHTADQSRRSVEIAMSAGFETVSLDLIYGLPDDDAEQVEHEVETALRLAPDHLSAYQLGMPDGTPLGRQRDRGDVEELADDHQRSLFELVHNRLRDGGLCPYEVSNFARSEADRSRHNQKYWVHTPYIGFGPGAHSFDGTRRWWNERVLKDYERLLDNGGAIIDSRGPGSRSGGYVKGSIHAGVNGEGMDEASLAEIAKKDQVVTFYCSGFT